MSLKNLANVLLVIVFVFLVLVSTVFAQQKFNPSNNKKTFIEDNEFSIKSTKDVFYCQPIISKYGCLIKADIKIKNKQNKVAVVGIDSYFHNKDIKLIGYKARTKTGIKKFKPKDLKDFSMLDSEESTVTLYFWAKQSGKFDLILNKPNAEKLILDPYYNVSINSTYPSYHLRNITLNLDNNEVGDNIEISAELSDNLSTTNYSTFLGKNLFSYNLALDFNELSDTYVYDVSGYNNNGVSNGVTFVDGVSYNAVNFNGNSNIVVPDDSSLNFGTNNFTYCFFTKVSGLDGSNDGLISKRSNDEGYEVRLMDNGITGTLRCVVQSTGGLCRYTDNQDLNDGKWHSICCRRNNNNVDLFVDGVYKGSNSGCSGDTSNNLDLYIGSDQGGNINYEGIIDELFIAPRYLTNDEILIFNNSKSIYNLSLGYGLSVFFNYSIDPAKIYSINIKSNIEHLEPVRIYSYINGTHINQSSYIDYSLDNIDDYIRFDSIVSDGYNNPFRIYSLKNTFNITDVFLYELTEDNESPVISNCTLNITQLYCGETVKASCDVTDNDIIDSVYFYGQHGNGSYIMMKAVRQDFTDHYYIEKTFCQSYTSTITSTFLQVNATDIAGNSILFQPNLTVNYTCLDISRIFNCFYNPNPYLKSKIPFTKHDYIDWLCYINRSYYSCVSEVYKDGNLIQSNPDRKYVRGVGVLDKFEGSGYKENYFRVWFNKKNLLPDETFNFTVRCDAGDTVLSFSRLIKPVYKDLSVVAYRTVWLKRNMPIFILFMILIFFTILFIITLIK